MNWECQVQIVANR